MDVPSGCSVIERQRTAIRRKYCSRPTMLALTDKVLVPGMSFFDYGCGHGQDIEFVANLGIDASGYDPYFFPDEPKKSADVVVLGYVINVIENPSERIAVLKEAFTLATSCLVIATRLSNTKIAGASAFGDGIITRRKTFQKYYRSKELKNFLIEALKATPHSADTGVCYLFKDQMAENLYLLNKIVKSSDHLNACFKAKSILAELQKKSVISKAIAQSPLGKKLPNTLYVHNSAISYLPTILRLYIACGQILAGKKKYGDLLVKLSSKSISFLWYRNFDDDPHPELLYSQIVKTETYETAFRDYSKSDNPPILHRKETFVAKNYPHYRKFRETTVHEEKLGLLNRTDIGYKKNWQKLIESTLL